MTTTDELAKMAPNAGAPLSELQEWMAKVLRHSRGLTKSEAFQQAAALHFSGNERLSPAAQVDIYRRQFWLRHTSLLVEDFPGLSSLLGQSAWERVAESYLTTRAYDVFALRELALGMPEHLREFANLEPSLPHPELLILMAKLECAYVVAFHAEDDPVLSAEALAKIPAEAWPQATIQLSHSLQLLTGNYEVATLRRQLKENPRLGRSHVPARSERNLVVYRREGNLWDKAVSRAAFQLLTQFQKGLPLVPACEAVVADFPEAASIFDAELFEWFALWGRLGWITDVRAPE